MPKTLPSRRGFPAAFTLVELLVVIGIIGVLLAILLPSLARARESARTIKCISNMRSLMQGIQSYGASYSGALIPTGTFYGGWWSNILVDGKFVTAPTLNSTQLGAGPLMEGPFFCPSGNSDLFPPNLTNNTAVPADRQDVSGAMAWRFTSPRTQTTVDLWYGMNGQNSEPAGNYTSGPPTRRVENSNSPPVYMRMHMIKQASEMVILYDGLIYHHMNVNANRVNARHNNRTVTNLAFMDGRAESYPTSTLPGGLGAATVADFSLANLNANFKNGPKWRLEQ